MGIAKGICYGNDAFPAPYNPSAANTTQVFFGSDPAAAYIGALWSTGYTSSTGARCETGVGPQVPSCRNDIDRMKDMGVEVIRLYDWDPRNDHQPFLDLCRTQGIGVLVSVSNWFLQPGGGLPTKDANIQALIRSFSNQAGTDYHPAVVGIVIGNEFDGYSIADCAAFTNSLVEIESSNFPGYRKVRIGHPLAFIKQGQFPGWHAWDELLPQVAALGQRLFLAPQTYNDAEGSGKGWVEQTWDKYKVPIWFTEIGQDRTKPNYQTVVDGQLGACLTYAGQHPEQLLGACFFGFGDKIWMAGTSEGSFGAYSHQAPGPCTITFSEKDFTHWDVAPNWGTLNVDVLSETPLHGVVKTRYAG